MDKKLNNLIEFKEFGKLDKLENTPGKKVVEKLNNVQSFDNYIDEGLVDNIRKGAGFKNKEEKFKETEESILKHPMKRKVYQKFKSEDPNKAKKYIEFFVKNPQGQPKWDGNSWVDTVSYNYS